MNAQAFPDRLQTARLLLRPVVRGDAQALFDAYCQDSEVTRYLTWKPHRTVAETIEYVEDYCLAATDWRTYALVGIDGGELLGAFDIRRPRQGGQLRLPTATLGLGTGPDDRSPGRGRRLGTGTT